MNEFELPPSPNAQQCPISPRSVRRGEIDLLVALRGPLGSVNHKMATGNHAPHFDHSPSLLNFPKADVDARPGSGLSGDQQQVPGPDAAGSRSQS